ncbi:hypothetical protein [Propionivibrio sp.]|uniref:hypothetical protein n=1 Tax=Propionivibrio sp. TaxID=2212460 RepID=UPI00261EC6D4|nr:hypothetical protein [Propionivibrio sp.]
MSLVTCRACDHQVDTSALACPKCGATDPAKKISRQRRDARNFIIQTIIWLSLIGCAGWYVWNTLIPVVKQYIVKPQNDQSPVGRP